MQQHKTKCIVVMVVLALAVLVGFLPSQAAQAADDCRANYTVRSGDTLAKIAQKYNIKVEDMNKINRLYFPYRTIYVNQNLCIPASASSFESAPAYANAKAADFKISLVNKTLFITGANLPKNSAYYIKVGDPTSASKVGQINTKSGGSLEAKITLPAKYQSESKVTVCFKNNATDANVCRTAVR